MSNVFVLGSGFSKNCGLPILAELFGEMLAPGVGQPDDVTRVKGALEFLYPHLKAQSGYDGCPPFEEFLSLVTVSKGFEPQLFEKGDWSKVEQSSLRLLANCLITKTQEAISNENQAIKIKRFVKAVQPGDTIITFNWDTVVEQYLCDAKKKFVGGVSNQSDAISLLKLHGSLSWVWLPDTPQHQQRLKLPEGWSEIDSKDTPQKGLAQSQSILLYRLDNKFLACLWEKLGELNARNPQTLPYIVPPIWHKTPFDTAILQSLWYHAAVALDAASKIFVIGYSLPPEDLHAQALFRAVIGYRLKQNETVPIHLIDPNPAVAGRFYTIVAKHLDYHQTCFTGAELERILDPPIEQHPAKDAQRKARLKT